MWDVIVCLFACYVYCSVCLLVCMIVFVCKCVSLLPILIGTPLKLGEQNTIMDQ